jgi:hypothetical protein
MNEIYRYAAALNFILLACALTFFLQPYITQTPTVFFALAVLVCSLTLGMGPALASALLGITIAGYFFMEPVHSFHVNSASDLMRLAFMLIMAITVSSVVEAKQRLERTLLLLRGLEPQLGICEICSRVEGFHGEWLTLADVVKKSGIPLVAKSCPECHSRDAAPVVVSSLSSEKTAN